MAATVVDVSDGDGATTTRGSPTRAISQRIHSFDKTL